ncbi:hypothetical protein PIB30_107239, partial [Stylosanthes scabra]|nr:hypothetical protein [Stylosanthes scabra]
GLLASSGLLLAPCFLPEMHGRYKVDGFDSTVAAERGSTGSVDCHATLVYNIACYPEIVSWLQRNYEIMQW